QGPGARAGARVGDILFAVGDRPVHGAGDLRAILRAIPPGRALVLRLGAPNRAPRIVRARPQAVPLETASGLTITYDAIRSAGTLRRVLFARPARAGRYPGVLIVGGIGCYSLDNPGAPGVPYRDFAQGVSRAGFVTLRVEKSSMGDSRGPPCENVDLHDEERSYVAALTALRRSPFVDTRRIYLFGHSIGGVLVPMLAARHRIDGAIIADSTGRTWFEYELINQRRQLVLAGTRPERLDAAMRRKEFCMHRLLIDGDAPATVLRERPDCANDIAYPASYRYLRQVAAFQPAPAWQRIDAPLLVIHGGSDYITDRADDQAIAATVNALHPGHADFEQISGLDHFMDRRTSQAASFRAGTNNAPPAFDADIVDAVVAWLRRRDSPSS
ncbi:MAG: alpha/beta fold hydrolase, partial [Candidatus Elarobacter sp.]